jgi:hypothetical protein
MTKEEIDDIEARLRREMAEHRAKYDRIRIALGRGEVVGLPACPVVLKPREKLH